MVPWKLAPWSNRLKVALALSRLLLAACLVWAVGTLARARRDTVRSAHRPCASRGESGDYQLSADGGLGEFCRVAAPFVAVALLSRLSGGSTRDE